MKRLLKCSEWFCMCFGFALMIVAALAAPENVFADGVYVSASCLEGATIGDPPPCAFEDLECRAKYYKECCAYAKHECAKFKHIDPTSYMMCMGECGIFNCASDCKDSNCYTTQVYCTAINSCSQNDTCVTKCKCINKRFRPNYECICTPR